MIKNFLYIISTHPIQYFVPLYKELSKDKELEVQVFFCSDETLNGGIDKQFGIPIKWDIPLLEGYKYKFLKNYSWKPSINNGFFGLINFQLIKELWNAPKGMIMISGWMNFTYILSIFIAKLRGHNISLRCESPLIHEKGRSRMSLLTRKIIFKYFLFPNINTFHYIGNQNRLFYKFYGVSDQKLFFTPYSVDNDRFNGDYICLLNERQNIKSSLGLNLTKKIILFSGKYIQKKRPLDLLKAIQKIDNIIVVFVGEGELRQEMENFITVNNLETKAKLIGFVNQTKMSQYYLISDIFVMCSEEGETWGLSTNEAMNFGLPIILYDSVGSASDLVDEGVNGFIIPKGDIEKLRLSVEKLINDEEFRLTAGKRSSEIIKRYSYSNIIKGIKYSLVK